MSCAQLRHFILGLSILDANNAPFQSLLLAAAA